MIVRPLNLINQLVPEVYVWIDDQALGRPVHSFNSIVTLLIHVEYRNMTAGVIIMEVIRVQPIALFQVQTDQAREETDEIIDVNHDSESKFAERSGEHDTFDKANFQVQPKTLRKHKKHMKPQVYQKIHGALSKRHKKEEVEHTICRSSRDNKSTMT
ncbi:hypothetical protein TNCV_3281661 [Trichonephila clavipes]|nr:hypothetical protein TNCV_3281661 [Trichonephila clavipes]